MSSLVAATAGPESVITVKINYDGCTRRAKMVLRDMVPGQLEQQVFRPRRPVLFCSFWISVCIGRPK
jgi:hypothetical protein